MECGSVIADMEKELSLGQVEPNMRASSRMTVDKERAKSHIKMEHTTKDNGKAIREMDREDMFSRVEPATRGSSAMTRCMVKDNSLGTQEPLMRASGATTASKAMER